MSDWPDTLPGLDLSKALNQLGGKKSLYVRLLGMFNDAHTGDVERLIAAAEAQDWVQVHEINHALKGVTGNIAASELYQLSCNLDLKVKSDNHQVQAELAAMPAAMNTLMTSIEVAKQLPVE